jgi:hypothetical protein
MPDSQPDTTDDIEEADTANGEPAATDEPTGEAQAAENRENDPPA